jgi:hypothetical protein
MRRLLPTAVALLALALGLGLREAGAHSTSAVERVSVRGLDVAFAARWAAAQVTPAPPAEDLTLLRRLTLALCGVGPSLEEERAFEADAPQGRVERALERLLEDGRTHRYLAQRLARVFVGNAQGPFIVYRRDLLVDWLAQQLAAGTPYDALVRELVSARGLWTSEPATNFVTATAIGDQVDTQRLAGKTMRAVLGLRMDCAQCHDHPFADFTQKQFLGVAGFYEGLRVSPEGVTQPGLGPGAQGLEGSPAVLEQPGFAPRVHGPEVSPAGLEQPALAPKGQGAEVPPEKLKQPALGPHAPAVPFGEAWLPSTGAPRTRLAAWLTDARNRRFARATVNRVWGLLLGRALVEPVDDVPAPGEERGPLDVLADDFVTHGHDWRRLVRAIVGSAPFRASSQLPREADRAALEAQWAVFPLTPLRPEQLVGALLQAASVRTIDVESHVLVRAVRLLRERAFVEEYGDGLDDELASREGTVPQALLRMNGKLPQELVDAQPFGAVARIAAFAPDDAQALDALTLAFLTRHPSPAERAQMVPQLEAAKGEEHARLAEDVAWALFNSEEFAWNH